ncbi:MAG: hypothetical protein C4334_07735 [Pyrinomonas sp.]
MKGSAECLFAQKDERRRSIAESARLRASRSSAATEGKSASAPAAAREVAADASESDEDIGDDCWAENAHAKLALESVGASSEVCASVADRSY